MLCFEVGAPCLGQSERVTLGILIIVTVDGRKKKSVCQVRKQKMEKKRLISEHWRQMYVFKGILKPALAF